MAFILSFLPQESGEGGRSLSELLQELQEVKGEASSTREELNCYRELSHKLQEEIEVQTLILVLSSLQNMILLS